MADPLSLTASLIAVLQLSAEATKYLKEIRHGSADRVRLRDELRNATCLLEMLKDRAEDSEDETTGALKAPAISSLTAPDGPLALFKYVLEGIIAKLLPQDRLRKLAQPFVWPFNKKDISDMLNVLERLKSHFTLLMQNDLVELAKLSNLKLDAIDHQVKSIENKRRDDDTEAILTWISSLSFRAKQATLLDGVQPGTGSWLLQHATFQDWVNGKVNALWCPGIPGAGKTLLASLVIDYMERQRTSSEWILAYCYCDYNQVLNQTTTNFVSSFLEQVLRRMPTTTLPSEIMSLFELHKRYGTRPTLAQLTEIFRKCCSSYKSVLIVIDALDEYSTSDDTSLEFIRAVQALGPGIRILCTSRFSTTFENFFKDAQKLEITAQSQDIRVFLEARISQHSRLSKHVRGDPTLAIDIVEAIIQQAQGMFLLATFHLESLARKINRKDIRSSLQTLPKTLDVIYEQALHRLQNQAEEDIELAELVLFWVVCARRPLTVLELQQMYAMTVLANGEMLEDGDLPDGDILTSVCGGLIVVSAESSSIRLVHYTAQQYFERVHQDRLLRERRRITRIALAYLRLPNFSSGARETDDSMSDALNRYPFLTYAAHYWGSDIPEIGLDSIWEDVQGFLSNDNAVDLASQVWSLPEHRSRHWSQEFPRRVPALVLAASFDLPELLHRLVKGGLDLEGRGTDDETPLIRSAKLALTRNVVVLLELGAQADAVNSAGETALEGAAGSGNSAVVEVLLKWGADVSRSASKDWTLLMVAVSSGSIEAVRLLVEAGANVSVENSWGDSALSIATRVGDEAIANYLADCGASLPNNVAGRRASVSASRKGLHTLVRRLTADYHAVAGAGLQRQRPGLDGFLNEIREDREEPLGDNALEQAETGLDPNRRDETILDISEALHGLSYTRGFSRRYDLLTLLGKGHSAEVNLCVNKVTAVKYAAKVFTGRFISDKIHTLRAEISFLKEIQHSNILRLIDLMVGDTLESLYLVMEIAEEGELFNWIVSKQKLTESETRRVFTQLFSAVQFMHERGWIHRDIKPENILLSGKDRTIKLADFGLAANVRERARTQGLYWHTLAGTPSYVAPEVLAPAKDRNYTFSVDIWSAGVVMYICLCGFPPFSDELYTEENPYTLAQQIRMGRFDYPSPYWDSVGDPALELIDYMLTVDTKKRYTIAQCAQHPWMLGGEALEAWSSSWAPVGGAQNTLSEEPSSFEVGDAGLPSVR